MNGGEDQMAGFGGAQGETHRFRIAHFADHQHVGIFAQRIEQCLFEAGRIAANFTLPNVRLSWTEVIFDGAFDGDNVARFSEIYFFEQRGQRRRFA
jgi:hypothetical protein